MPAANELIAVVFPPLDQVVVKGAVPPIILTTTVPFAAAQVALVEDAEVESVPAPVFTFAEVLATHPLSSVIVTL